MTTAEGFALLVKLAEEYGPDAYCLIVNLIKSLERLDAVTNCGICGAECPVYTITVGKTKVYRGDCPTHGFKR